MTSYLRDFLDGENWPGRPAGRAMGRPDPRRRTQRQRRDWVWDMTSSRPVVITPSVHGIEVGPAILAWRVWWARPIGFLGQDWRLFSHSQKKCMWPTGKALQATSRPRIGSGLGIHAFKERQHAEGLACRITDRKMVPVYGCVSLWGRYVEAELGYRAEYAYPYELFVPDPTIAAALRTAYAVDVTVIGALSHQPDPFGLATAFTVQLQTLAAKTANIAVNWKTLSDALKDR